MRKALILAFLAGSVAFGQESRGHSILRRVLASGACALTTVDAFQTANALGPNIHEGNPIGFNASMFAIKGLGCAAPLIIGEFAEHRHNERLANAMTVVSGAEIGVFTAVVIHNARVIGSTPKQPGQLAEGK